MLLYHLCNPETLILALACGPTLSPYSLLNKIKLHVPAWLFLTIHCSTVTFGA